MLMMMLLLLSTVGRPDTKTKHCLLQHQLLFVCVYVCARVCLRIYVYEIRVRVNVCLYLYLELSLFLCMCVCACMCLRVGVRRCVGETNQRQVNQSQILQAENQDRTTDRLRTLRVCDVYVYVYETVCVCMSVEMRVNTCASVCVSNSQTRVCRVL